MEQNKDRLTCLGGIYSSSAINVLWTKSKDKLYTSCRDILNIYYIIPLLLVFYGKYVDVGYLVPLLLLFYRIKVKID